jgi:hypothetical protein
MAAAVARCFQCKHKTQAQRRAPKIFCCADPTAFDVDFVAKDYRSEEREFHHRFRPTSPRKQKTRLQRCLQ